MGAQGCYPQTKACQIVQQCSLGSRNARQIAAKVWALVMDYLQDQCNPAQTANQVGVGHETIYSYAYADKAAASSSLYKELCCKKQCNSDCAFIIKAGNQISEPFSRATINKIKDMSPVVKTLTFENCKEFAEHARMDVAFSSATCFANIFCSWQRVSNLRFNGLLR